MSEKRYRDLVPYEDVFQEGDETQVAANQPWQKTHPQVFGKSVRPGFRHRRPIAEPVVKDSLTTESQTPHCPKCGESGNMIQKANGEWVCHSTHRLDGPTVDHSSEAGNMVATPRKPKITDEEARRRLNLIPCMVEITDAYSDSNDTLAAPDITPILSKHIQAVEKERDEWMELSGKLAKLLDENCYGYEQYEVDVTTCNSCGSSRGHNDDCEIKEALAAYELKAKEGA